MWLLNNETPFAADRSWVRDEAGAEVWLTVIKATFKVADDGRQEVAPEQVPVSLAPVFAGDPAETGLLEETDYNLAKPRTDVLVAGHGYPARAGDDQALIRLKLADIDKTLRVHGDRQFVDGPVFRGAGAAAPITRVPVDWRCSYGGTDSEGRKPEWVAENPVGAGFATDPARLAGRLAPNWEYPDAPYGGPRDGRAAGFGPVARHWKPRVGYAGTYDAAWEKTRDPLPPLDFDRQFFQCAPRDQQTAKPLQGYEDVRLGNLTPDGFWQFRLPRITFDIRTEFYRKPTRRHEAAQIHTLWLWPDRREFTIVWLSALPVPHDEERLKQTTIRLRPRRGVPEAVRKSGVWVP